MGSQHEYRKLPGGILITFHIDQSVIIRSEQVTKQPERRRVGRSFSQRQTSPSGVGCAKNVPRRTVYIGPKYSLGYSRISSSTKRGDKTTDLK